MGKTMKKRQITALNKRISIVTQTTTDDGMGGEIETDSVFCLTWAAIWPVSSKEMRENMREVSNVTHNIRIRYRPGVLHTMTLLFGSRKFEIKGIINPDEANKWLDMVCNELI
jgi:SPP1 family predicted phage head-tail adaptor